jgi:hypothetical protein
MADGRAGSDVDAGGVPALRHLGKRRRRRRGLELAEPGDAHRRQLAPDPAASGQRLAPCPKRACVAVRAFAAAEPVLDQVAAPTGRRLAPFDPDASHGRAVPDRRGRCAARAARDTSPPGSSAASSRAGQRPATNGRRRRPPAAPARVPAGANGSERARCREQLRGLGAPGGVVAARGSPNIRSTRRLLGSLHRNDFQLELLRGDAARHGSEV